MEWRDNKAITKFTTVDSNYMIFEELTIPNVFLIRNPTHTDQRGSFTRSFCSKEFLKNGLMSKIAQGNISTNTVARTLRGFHYQKFPYQESKVISCISGAIHNVVIDLRPNSTTFLKHIFLILDQSDRISLHIPAGCANAWITLKDNTILHYYMSDFYEPDFSFGIRWNDPFFKINWPIKPVLISNKDQSYEDFNLEKFMNSGAV